MKVSELSERAGVPLPTIKFYIREKLLPAGVRTGKNQAEYDEEHLERLALIRALREDAGLSVAAIARALRAADTAKEEFIGAAIDAIERPAGPRVDERSSGYKQAKVELLALIEKRGWRLRESDLSVRDAARALAVLRRSFPDIPLDIYADAVELLAPHEIPERAPFYGSPSAALRYAMLGTVLVEPLLLALRRMAHGARTRRLRCLSMPEKPDKPRGRRASPRRAL